MDKSKTYIFRKPCGCVAAMISDDIDKRDLAKEMAEYIRKGLTVEHVDDATAVREFCANGCEACRPKSSKRQTTFT